MKTIGMLSPRLVLERALSSEFAVACPPADSKSFLPGLNGVLMIEIIEPTGPVVGGMCDRRFCSHRRTEELARGQERIGICVNGLVEGTAGIGSRYREHGVRVTIGEGSRNIITNHHAGRSIR